MDKLPNPVDYAVPAFVLLILVEMIVARAKDRSRYCPRDTLNSMLMGFGSTIAGALAAGIIFGIASWFYRFRLVTIPYAWWSWIACFVLNDLCYYWQHRLGHRIRWMWASHINHHSSQHYNLSTALRQTWTGFFAANFLIYLPLYLAGFPPPMVFFVGALNLIYQFWIHTEAIGRCPRWFEAVMNTPSHHRVHHATNPRYLDRNYAGVFIVWDKLFGTFVAEDDRDKIRYGIVKQLPHHGLLWGVFHEWIGILRDLWSAPWRAKLGYAIREPGWSHDGSRETSDMIRRRWEEREACRARDRNSTSSSSARVPEAAPPPGA